MERMVQINQHTEAETVTAVSYCWFVEGVETDSARELLNWQRTHRDIFQNYVHHLRNVLCVPYGTVVRYVVRVPVPSYGTRSTGTVGYSRYYFVYRYIVPLLLQTDQSQDGC